MENLLPFFVLLPFLGFISSLIPANYKEKAIFLPVMASLLLHLSGLFLLGIGWALANFPKISWASPPLYETASAHFVFGYALISRQDFLLWSAMWF